MNIQKPKWHWSEPLDPLNLSRVDAIALHHMAHPTWDMWDVEKCHLGKGWRGIGYGWWIGFDGQIYEGRGFNVNAGVENQNGHILSIGFQGDYDKTNKVMPDVQFNSGVELIEYIRKQVPTIKTVDGHGSFMKTACPGKYFPLREMKLGKLRNAPMTIEQAIDYAASIGVIKDPIYWKANTVIGGNPNPVFVASLIMQMANKFKEVMK
jgi:hypothetical protein